MINWQPEGAPPMLPLLFITIACGACSGFHCLVGSGTTSKQIANERDARAVGYGSMLTEGFLATLVIAACAGGIGLSIKPVYFVNVELYDFLERQGAPAPQSSAWTRESGWIPGASGFIDPEHPVVRGAGPKSHTSLVPVDADTPMPVWIETDEGAYRLRTHYWGSGSDLHLVDLRGKLVFAKQYESWSAAGGLARTVGAFVEGAANFVASLGVPLNIAIALMGVMVASFAATTMDTACRLQRYVVQELARTFLPRRRVGACAGCGYDMGGIKGSSDQGIKCPECGKTNDPQSLRASVPSCLHASPWNPFRYLATVHGATIFAVVTALALAFIPPTGTAWSLDVAGRGGLILWPLFGATNQLLAGFAFVVITAWLIATKRPWWFAVVPGVFMLCVPAWAMAWQAFIGNDANASWLEQRNWVLVTVASVTLLLEAWLLLEVAVRWFGRQRPKGA